MQSKPRMTPNRVQIRVNNESSIKQYCESVGQSRIIEQLDVSITADPNLNYNKLHGILHELHEKHFPNKEVRFNKYKHKKSTWITIGIMNSIKHKDKLYRILKQTCQNDESYNVFGLNLRVYKNILNSAIRKAKRIHYAHLFDLYKTNMRKIWETIKQLLNKNYKQFEFPSTFKINGVNISDKKEIAQQFNNFFVNIGGKLAETILPKHQTKPFDSYLKDRCNSTFNFVPVTRDEVISVIHNFAQKKSAGHDLISTHLLKEISLLIAEPLSLIINQSLCSGIFPSKLKIAKVIPLHKKNEKDLLDNYRPISLLPSISKVFERIVYNQLYSYLTTNGILFKSQYGFRKLHSTETAAIELTDTLLQNLDNGDIPIAIFLDLSKAFDTLDHAILLKKTWIITASRKLL